MIELSKKDFRFNGNKPQLVNRNASGKHSLILVKTDWCGYCKEAKPEFKATADLLEGKKIFFGVIDGDKNEELISKLQVNSFPTILFVDKNGYVKNVYSGDRNKYAFAHYLCIQTRECR